MSQTRLPLVIPDEIKPETRPEVLAKRASCCGAMLTLTTRQTLVIRRGASSWHCTDGHAALTILRQLESRTLRQGACA